MLDNRNTNRPKAIEPAVFTEGLRPQQIISHSPLILFVVNSIEAGACRWSNLGASLLEVVKHDMIEDLAWGMACHGGALT